MIGIFLLIIALTCYFQPRYRWFSYFMYVSFMLGYGGGLGLWTDRIIGAKNGDLAVVYTFVISMHLLMKKRYRFPNLSFIKQYKWVIAFLVCSMLFSIIHYGISPYYVLQGSRSYLLLFSLPILYKIKKNEFDRLMRALMWITTVTSVLYILQIAVDRPLMPYADGTAGSYDIDASTGLVRLYNFPVLNVFFLAMSFVNPKYFGNKINVFRIIFFTSLMCTLGRTGIFAGIMTVGLAVLFTGKTSKLIKMTCILGILFLPFAGMIGNRFEKGGTGEDLQALMNDNAKYYTNANDGGTMTYRIAWILERTTYLSERPIGEKIFGLGLITDSYPKLSQMYRFRLGLQNPVTKEATQMITPDIAYGNLISLWGYGGTIIYLLFAMSMAVYLYKHRKDNPFISVASADIIMMFVTSFSGSTLSEPKNFVIYYIVMSTIYMCKKQPGSQ